MFDNVVHNVVVKQLLIKHYSKNIFNFLGFFYLFQKTLSNTVMCTQLALKMCEYTQNYEEHNLTHIQKSQKNSHCL